MHVMNTGRTAQCACACSHTLLASGLVPVQPWRHKLGESLCVAQRLRARACACRVVCLIHVCGSSVARRVYVQSLRDEVGWCCEGVLPDIHASLQGACAWCSWWSPVVHDGRASFFPLRTVVMMMTKMMMMMMMMMMIFYGALQCVFSWLPRSTHSRK